MELASAATLFRHPDRKGAYKRERRGGKKGKGREKGGGVETSHALAWWPLGGEGKKKGGENDAAYLIEKPHLRAACLSERRKGKEEGRRIGRSPIRFYSVP